MVGWLSLGIVTFRLTQRCIRVAAYAWALNLIALFRGLFSSLTQDVESFGVQYLVTVVLNYADGLVDVVETEDHDSFA